MKLICRKPPVRSLEEVTSDLDSCYEYGTCNGIRARRNKSTGHVQFVIFKVGDQRYADGVGHLTNKWTDFDKSWWSGFSVKTHLI